MLNSRGKLVFIKTKSDIETESWGMRKIIILFWLNFILAGCAESVALLGPASTAAGGGNLMQSSFTTVASYGIKKQTGKGPLDHVIAYAEKLNPEKKEEPCLSFLQKTNTEILASLIKLNI